jgi:hypothetical protein
MERLRPLRQPGQDLRAADRDLDREEDRRPNGQPDERRMIPLGSPGHDRQDGDDDSDDGRDPAVQDVRGRRISDGGQQRTVHQRPVREDECGRRGGHVRTEEEQGERDGRGERREQGEPLAPATTADPSRIPGPDRQEDEQAHQRKGCCEVSGHRFTAVPEADSLAPQPCLETDQADGPERWPQDRASVAMIDDGEQGKP